MTEVSSLIHGWHEAEVLLDHVDLEALVAAADLVITAEGAVDYQTPKGKIPAEVARRGGDRCGDRHPRRTDDVAGSGGGRQRPPDRCGRTDGPAGPRRLCCRQSLKHLLAMWWRGVEKDPVRHSTALSGHQDTSP